MSAYNLSRLKDCNYNYDTNEVFYLSNATGIMQVFKMDMENRKEFQITNTHFNIEKYWILKNKEFKICFSKEQDGDEKEQLFLLDTANNIQQITYNENNYYYYGFEDANKNGLWYFENVGNSTIFNIYHYNFKEKKSKLIISFNQSVSKVLEIDNENIIIATHENYVDHKIYILNIKTLKLKHLDSYSGSLNSLSLFDKSNLLVSGDNKKNYSRIFKINVFDDRCIEIDINVKEYDIENAILSKDKDKLFLIVNVNGYSNLYQYEINSKSLKEIKFESKVVIESAKIDNNDNIFFIYSGVNIPYTLAHINIQNMKVETIVKSKSDKKFVDIELNNVVDSSGFNIPYYIYLSSNQNKTILYLHGGPESQERPVYNELFRKLNLLHDYNIIIPNIRGSKGYGREYLFSDIGQNRLEALNDIVNIRDHAIETYNLNEHKIDIMGTSYGGYMTLLCITQKPELWNKAVDIVGMSSVHKFLETTPQWRRKLRSYKYGEINEFNRFFASTDPINNVKEINTSLLLIHGENDARVPYQQSLDIYMKLRENDKTIKLISFKDEGHSFKKPINLEKVHKEIISFLNKQEISSHSR